MRIRRLNQIRAAAEECGPARFGEWLEQGIETEPRCPIVNYLLGCHCFDRGRRARAVRLMMTAHHVEPTFESAALLVFAGLNWVHRDKTALLPVLLDTWEEYRRPAFDRHRNERLLLDAFAKPADELNGVSPLARQLWRLPIRTLRAQLRAALLSPGAGQYPLLLTPA